MARTSDAVAGLAASSPALKPGRAIVIAPHMPPIRQIRRLERSVRRLLDPNQCSRRANRHTGAPQQQPQQAAMSRIFAIRHAIPAFGAALLAAVWAGPLAAQPIGDTAAGHALATAHCAECHAISPAEQEGSLIEVPTFAAIAQLPSTTAMSLRAFLQSPHATMPNLRLSHDEIEDVAAYILGLRRR
jgi:mono/diheme cytochrome c family protein